MNLELGKQYVRRNNDVITIVEYDTDKNNKFPFTATDGCRYTKDGHFKLYGVKNKLDIVSEYKPASQSKVIHETSTTILQTALTHDRQQIRTSLQKIEASVKKLEELLLPERKSKMNPCEFALAFQAWSMAIQAKLSHDLPNVSVEDLAKQYGQHTTTPENLDKVSHCFDWNTVMEFIENEKETISV
jgi:hypothetical protein